MIILANVIDEDGFIIEPIVVLTMDVLQKHEIKDIVPEGLYTPKWDYSSKNWVEGASLNEVLTPLKTSKAEELSSMCNQLIEKGFFHNGDLFQFNMIDQSNFNQQLSMIPLDTNISTIYWKTENNGVKAFTKDEFIAICKTGEYHKKSHITHYWNLKNYIFTHNFEGLTELTSIDFSFSPTN